MKLKFNLLMMLAVVFMASCSDDDKPAQPAQDIAGTYTGYSMALEKDNTIPVTTAGQSLSVTATDNTTCTITFNSGKWGTFTTTAATVTLNNDGYQISGSGSNFNLKGTISSDKKTVSLQFTTDELTLTFISGDAPANSLIAGKYKGYSVTTHGMTPVPTAVNGETVTITSNEDGTCNIAVTFQTAIMGKATITDAEVTLSGDNYTIKGEGETVMGMDPSNQTTYTTQFEGTISKDLSKVSLVFTTEIGGPMATIVITVNQGDAPAAMLIAKAYKGTLDTAVMGASQGSYTDHAVTIKGQEDGKAEITLSGFGQGAMAFGNMTFADVEVTEEAGIYTLSAEIDIMDGDRNVTGNIEGTIEDGNANITFNLKPGAMPMFVVCTYEGK